MQHAHWIDRTGFFKLFGVYLLVLAGVFVASVIVFFFPIMPLCWLLGIEFSNLGPIATAFWGILINIFIVTPGFGLVLVAKLVCMAASKADE
jgi:hypothetical protein